MAKTKAVTATRDKPNTDRVLVCAYGRVSTGKIEQANSYEAQEKHFKDKYKDSEEYEFVGFYGDKGSTGTSIRQREQFKKMLHDAGIDIDENEMDEFDDFKLLVSKRKPLFKFIDCKDVPRWGRNPSLQTIFDALRAKGVYVRFELPKMSTEDPNNSMTLGILGVVARQESEHKSVNVIRGQREGMDRGVIHVAPYGYRKRVDENGKTVKTLLDVVPEEAQVVKKIFDMYQFGKMGTRTIVNYLTKEGIMARNGKPFVKSTIMKILNNEMYTGKLVRGKYTYGTIFKDKTKNHRMTDPNTWIDKGVREGIPVIIQPEQFKRVQTVISKKVNSVNQKGKKTEISEYNGLLFCAKCGNPLISNWDRGNQLYNCKLKKTKGVKACDCRNVYVSDLEKLLQSWADGGYSSQLDRRVSDLLLKLQEKRKQLEDTLGNEDIQRIAEIYSRLLELQESESTILKLLLGKKLSHAVYEQEQAQIASERESLEEEREQLSANEEETRNKLDEIDTEIENLVNRDIKRKMDVFELRGLLSKIIVHTREDGYILQPIYKSEAIVNEEYSEMDFANFVPKKTSSFK